MRKKILLFMLTACLLLLPTIVLGEWVTVAENERLVLNYDPEVSQIMVQDLVTGASWQSTPEGFEEDKRASGMHRINRQSDLIVMYHNPTYVTNQVNSFTGSIKDGNFTWEKIENGIEIRYFFPKQGFLIPVRYQLEADCLKASILSEGILENLWTLSDDPAEIESASANKEKLSVMNVSLLPYMGAAGEKDEGYLVVPDGSGALIHFNNGRATAAVYQQDIFGRDSTLSVKKDATKVYQLNMPLFGMVKNGLGMMAVVENGEYQAQLNAAVAGQLTGYNNAYFTVSYINMESNTLMAGSNSSKSVTLATNTFRDMGDFVVRYHLLDKQDATYADIAAAYREQLGLHDLNAEEAPGTQLKLIASIPSTKTFIGIPYSGVTVLTSYQDAANVINELKAAGVDELTVEYAGWSKQSVRGKIVTSLDLDGRLGGKAGFEGLLKAVEQSGSKISLCLDIINLYKNGNGYWSLFSAADNINSTARKMNEYLMSTGVQDPSGKTWYLLRPDLVAQAGEKAANGLGGQKFGITLNTIGKTIYSSLGKRGISRTQSGAYWQQALQSLSAKVAYLTAEVPNSYAFPYVQQADDAPVASSRFDVTDTDIPFYQLVTHGAMVLYCEPLNELGNLEDAVLRLAEYGQYPSWRLIARDPALLSGTDGADWYATQLSSWKDEIVRVSAQMEALRPYAVMRMTGHEKLSADVSVTTYENGDQVFVNYGKSDIKIMGVSVQARGYAIKEAD